jgi:hypothetical protein
MQAACFTELAARFRSVQPISYKVVEHRLIDFAMSRIFIAIEAVEKQHIGQQAEHPPTSVV